MTEDHGSGVRRIKRGGKVYAIVVRKDYSPAGDVEFLTPDEYSQQLGLFSRPSGYEVEPHEHNSVARTVRETQEVILVRSGSLRATIYDDDKEVISRITLETGDVLMLVSGGHGFEMCEETELLEVKQGPYLGDEDKTRLGVDET